MYRKYKIFRSIICFPKTNTVELRHILLLIFTSTKSASGHYTTTYSIKLREIDIVRLFSCIIVMV